MDWKIVGQAIFKIVILILTQWFEKNVAKKKERKEIIEEIKDGIQTNDLSKITAGFDRARNL